MLAGNRTGVDSVMKARAPLLRHTVAATLPLLCCGTVNKRLQLGNVDGAKDQKVELPTRTKAGDGLEAALQADVKAIGTDDAARLQALLTAAETAAKELGGQSGYEFAVDDLRTAINRVRRARGEGKTAGEVRETLYWDLEDVLADRRL